jgi:hypothetical protein
MDLAYDRTLPEVSSVSREPDNSHLVLPNEICAPFVVSHYIGPNIETIVLAQRCAPSSSVCLQLNPLTTISHARDTDDL